ncbi:PaaI family thioesterase [Sphingobium aromaticiconvertens]|uniref:PaaI family thioesterase n=1 Tax=Sphingobium aromaticiconvertens TaxID=365341 RepID=UPI0030173A60
MAGQDAGDGRDGSPPEEHGWEPMDRPGPFTHYVGPFFMRNEGLGEGEPTRLGFRVQQHHCNPRLVCHGGMLATFVDLCLARGLIAAEGIVGSAPTITMTMDFLAGAAMGDWIESRISVVKITRQLGFVETILHGSQGPVLRGSGTYKRPRPPA